MIIFRKFGDWLPYRHILWLMILLSIVMLATYAGQAQSGTTSNPTPTLTPSTSEAGATTATATGTPPPEPIHFFLERPIVRENGDDQIDYIDRTYPYGGTQLGQLQIHLGVDFWNKRFTPVYASAEGIVIFAGTDDAVQFGPENDFYGNLVVIQHNLSTLEEGSIYTLYGHLESVDVQAGQDIMGGQKVGEVGDTGIAFGPHLHFEVRVGDPYDYQQTRNPELWLKNYTGFGALVGRVVDADGKPLPGEQLLIRSDQLLADREVYTYPEERVDSDIYWEENFVVGDLPQGSYEVMLREHISGVVHRQTVIITPNEISFVEFQLE